MDFTLPPPQQQSFTSWWRKKIPNSNEMIVYPGIQLKCGGKSRDLRSKMNSSNVFISHDAETNTFRHYFLASNNTFNLIPKRLFSNCFPNIHIHSVPPCNRIRVRLTEQDTLILPYIPDEFWEMKRQKRVGTNTRPSYADFNEATACACSWCR